MSNTKPAISGFAPIAMILIIVTVVVIGILTVSISLAHSRNRGFGDLYYGGGNKSSNKGGGGSTCRANGVTLTAPSGSSCSITSENGTTVCRIDGQPVACP